MSQSEHVPCLDVFLIVMTSSEQQSCIWSLQADSNNDQINDSQSETQRNMISHAGVSPLEGVKCSEDLRTRKDSKDSFTFLWSEICDGFSLCWDGNYPTSLNPEN